MKTTVIVEIKLQVEVEVSGKYHKQIPGTYYQRNGDPGTPPEPAQFEIDKVYWQGLDITPMLDIEDYNYYEIEERCLEKIDQELLF